MKLCNGYCDNCSLFGKKLTKDSKENNTKIFYEIDYYLKNKNAITDSNIALIKLDNNDIDEELLDKNKILKINYYIKYEDIFNDEIFINIDKNIKLLILLGMNIQLFIICNNLDEIINSYKKIKEKYDVDINFYTNFLFDTRKYPDLNVTQIIKQDMNKIIDKTICNNEILKKWDILVEYKITRGE